MAARGLGSVDHLADRPDVIGDPDRHCGSNPQALMNPAKVEVRNNQPDRVDLVFELFENALVSHANRRCCILTVRLPRAGHRT